MRPTGGNQALVAAFDIPTNALRVLANISGAFSMPPETAAVTVSYPDAVTEVFEFRETNLTGDILKTITLVYSDASKANLISALPETP